MGRAKERIRQALETPLSYGYTMKEIIGGIIIFAPILAALILGTIWVIIWMIT